MYRASTASSTLPASSSSIRSSACVFVSRVMGTWWYGTPNAATAGSRSGWFEITPTISQSSSPRRQRQSRSSRQWS